MNRPTPLQSDDAAGFWEASRERRFVLPWCEHCQAYFWYPRSVCPTCLTPEVSWREASGRGTVYAVSVQHNAALPQFKDEVPYAVALVELDEGPRMMTNVVGCPAEDVAVGQAVVLQWDPVEDGRAVPVFTPA